MNMEIPMMEIPETVEISNKFTDDERPNLMDKNYLKRKKNVGNGAFHAKKDKNKKENTGGSYKQKMKTKYKKPQTRSAKTKNKN